MRSTTESVKCFLVWKQGSHSIEQGAMDAWRWEDHEKKVGGGV